MKLLEKLFAFFNNKNIKKYLFISVILYFIFYTITTLIQHSVYFDEINAWNVAAYVDFFDLFKLMKYEGHLFIWFTLLMPFAKNDLFFPYSMQIMNWIFAFSAIIVMWRYAPFNHYAKAFITLSLPFLKIYPILARCYSLGILLLFIIAAIYPRRLKHHLIYTMLIILTANTSIMALAGATALGILFVYDLLKYKKTENISNSKLALILSAFAGCAVLVLGQLIDFSVPYYAVNNDYFSYESHFLFFYFPKSYDVIHVSFAIVYSFLLISAGKFFKNDLKPFFLIFLTHAILLYIFAFVYASECWHFCFLFIYFIISVWIYMSENQLTTKFQKIYISLFTLFCFMLIIYPSEYKKFIGRTDDLRDYIIEHIDTYSKAKMFFYPSFSFAKEITPYLEKYKLDFYDSYGNSIRSLDGFNIQYRDGRIDFNAISKKLGKGEIAYILMDEDATNTFVKLIEKRKNNINLLFLDTQTVYPCYIFKITKKK